MIFENSKYENKSDHHKHVDLNRSTDKLKRVLVPMSNQLHSYISKTVKSCKDKLKL